MKAIKILEELAKKPYYNDSNLKFLKAENKTIYDILIAKDINALNKLFDSKTENYSQTHIVKL